MCATEFRGKIPSGSFIAAALIAILSCERAGAAPARLDFAAARQRMVDKEIVAAGVTNPRVIEAMRKTPRHEFVPPAHRVSAYLDMALPIGEGQTISPPFIVAYMTEQLDPQPDDRVLEIGTGSGYQAAVLSAVVKEVYTIEIVEPLGRRAARDLKRLKYANVHAKIGDGFQGWAEHAPFDKIIVTCSPENVPPALVDQLREGGRMIIPVGQRYQQTFYLLKKVEGKMEKEALRSTLFVPMTGEAERLRKIQPDPANPSLVNGDFEDTAGDPEEPLAWHYQRQLAVVSDGEIPSGKKYVEFTNAEPGRSAHAIQGFAVDGRKAKALHVSLMVRAEEIRPGPGLPAGPSLVFTFYDEKRETIGEETLGPWRGSFAWRKVAGQVPVPPKAREVIIHIGLLGATGKIALDAIKVERAPSREK